MKAILRAVAFSAITGLAISTAQAEDVPVEGVEAAADAVGLSDAEAAATVETQMPAAEAVASEAPVAVVPGFVNAPQPGMGQAVFFRKGGLMGAAISCAASENDIRLTRLPPGKYSAIAVTPGIHEYAVKSEAKDMLRLEVEEGETYFAECSIKMGLLAGRPNLAPSTMERFVELSPKLKPVEVEAE